MTRASRCWARGVLLTTLTMLLSTSGAHVARGQAGQRGTETPPGLAGSAAYVRVNQVGYTTSEAKTAVVMATGPENGAPFWVARFPGGQAVYTGTVGAGRGAWNAAYTATYTLDFSAVTAPGNYAIVVGGLRPTRSPAFRVDSGAALYGPLLANAAFFYEAQRDGQGVHPAVMNRQPSHLNDSRAAIYTTPSYINDVLQGNLRRVGGPVDAAGGWFDAGDYIKFVATASYADGVMLLAQRQYPALYTGGGADIAAEARFGLDWLNKMWDPATGTLYYQVGIGDGNGSTIAGDHDIWRLPQADDAINLTAHPDQVYLKYRPVFRAGPATTPISPNLAGRLAADFGLCYQIYHASDPSFANACLRGGEAVFDQAQTQQVGALLTAAPHDYYPESEWRDDLEWGATELYNATAMGNLPPGLAHADPAYYLHRAAGWANAYIHSPLQGSDSLNLYDVGALAHYELYRAIGQAGNPPGLVTTQAALLSNMRAQLDSGAAQAATDPFGLGTAYGSGDAVPHALGLAVTAELYDELTGTAAYAGFAHTERDWVLGTNAWGASFIVGAGTTYPHCMQHEVANLSGSLDGTPPVVLGATVDGPSAAANFQGLGSAPGMRPCPTGGGDPFSQFTGKGARYTDNVVAWPSVEPADDYVALSLLLFPRQM